MSWWEDGGRAGVAHFRAEYLPISETFIRDVVVGTRGQRPVVVYGHRAYQRHFELPAGAVWTGRDFRSPYQDPPLELAARLRDRRVQVVHAHFGYDLPLAVLTARELGVPVIASFHGRDASTYLLDQRWRTRYRMLLPEVAAVVLDYRGMARRLVRLGAAEDRVHVIRTGIDLRFWPERRPPRRPGRIRIAMTGRMVPKKGHALLLEALAGALRRGLDAELTVLGAGPEEPLLREQVARLGLEGRVTLRPPAPRRSVRGLLLDADFFAAPSRTSPDGDEETTPLAIKEASACGLPVLSTLHAGIPDIIEDGVTGVLVEEGSAAALEEGLLRLASQPERWAEMGAAGRRRMETLFGLDHTLNRWRILYQSLARTAAPA